MTAIRAGGAKGIHSRLIETDDATDSLQVVDYAHHEIHAGSHFFFEDFAELANAGVYSIEFLTPDTTKWAHMLFSVKTDLATLIELYEGSDEASGGSAVSPVNNNRNSDTVSGMTIKTGVTPTSAVGGTRLLHRHVGSGTNPSQATAGEAERDSEIILKQNTRYLFMFTSEGADNNVDWRFSWYEHTNRNA
jgi:hypothetical protein